MALVAARTPVTSPGEDDGSHTGVADLAECSRVLPAATSHLSGQSYLRMRPAQQSQEAQGYRFLMTPGPSLARSLYTLDLAI